MTHKILKNYYKVFPFLLIALFFGREFKIFTQGQWNVVLFIILALSIPIGIIQLKENYKQPEKRMRVYIFAFFILMSIGISIYYFLARP